MLAQGLTALGSRDRAPAPVVIASLQDKIATCSFYLERSYDTEAMEALIRMGELETLRRMYAGKSDAYRACCTNATGQDKRAMTKLPRFDPTRNRVPRVLGNFELDRATRLLAQSRAQPTCLQFRCLTDGVHSTTAVPPI